MVTVAAHRTLCGGGKRLAMRSIKSNSGLRKKNLEPSLPQGKSCREPGGAGEETDL